MLVGEKLIPCPTLEFMAKPVTAILRFMTKAYRHHASCTAFRSKRKKLASFFSLVIFVQEQMTTSPQ
jgi:Na+/melibiose symporter-like transporter